MPCLPARCGMPEGLICEATRRLHVLLQRQQFPAASCMVNQSIRRNPLAAEQAADHADFLVLPVAQHHRVDAECMRIGRERAGAAAEDHPPAAHVIQLNHALRDIERVVIGQRHDAGGELDPFRPLRRGGRRSPARRSSPSRWSGVRRTRTRHSPACRVARRGRGRGGTAASGARRWDGAARGRRRSGRRGVAWRVLLGARRIPGCADAVNSDPIGTAQPVGPRGTCRQDGMTAPRDRS